MILKYGTYSHDDNEVTISIAKQPRFSPRGYRIGTRERWQIQGILQAADTAALKIAQVALEDAYKTNSLDLVLTTDGTTETAHTLKVADTLGGIRVVGGVQYPDGDGAELSTFRTYTIVVEGTRKDNERELLAFQETVDIQGSGGPRRVLIEVLNGPPQAQITNLATIQRIVQRGSALGYSTYPAPAAPSIPAWLSATEQVISRRGPLSIRGQFSEFGVQWQYVMLAPSPVTEVPQVV